MQKYPNFYMVSKSAANETPEDCPLAQSGSRHINKTRVDMKTEEPVGSLESTRIKNFFSDITIYVINVTAAGVKIS